MTKTILGKTILGLCVHLFLLSLFLEMISYNGNYARDFNVPGSLYLLNVPMLGLSLAMFFTGLVFWRVAGREG